MRVLTFACSFVLCFMFFGCEQNDVVENTPALEDKASLDYITIETEGTTYSLNPLESPGWYSGTYFADGVTTQLEGIKFDDAEVLSQLVKVEEKKNSIIVTLKGGTIEYTDFALNDGVVSFTGIDVENNIRQSLSVKSPSITSLEQFKDGFKDSFAQDKIWPVIAVFAIVIVVIIYDAALDHCRYVIDTVIASCTTGCVNLSGCSAQCVTCP